MAARAAVAGLIGNDPQMNMIGIDTTSVYASNATDTPNRAKMFVVVNWGDSIRSSGGLSNYLVSIWFHVPKEMERDYGKIDIGLLRIREIMGSAVHVAGSDGWVLTSASWITDSADGFDDGYNSLTRYAQFRCACRNDT